MTDTVSINEATKATVTELWAKQCGAPCAVGQCDCSDRAVALITALRSLGLAVVPIEPTENTLDAASEDWIMATQELRGQRYEELEVLILHESAKILWDRMLARAMSAEEE